MDWRSTKQTVVAISTVEADYVAMSKACVMALHFRDLLESMNEKQEQATMMFGITLVQCHLVGALK